MYNKAVFFDKDGTLIPDVPYNVDPALVTLSEKSVEGLKLLQQAGYLLVVVSNQAGIGYGYFTGSELMVAKNRLFKLFDEQGIGFSGFYYCPHLPTERCNCRKPKPGLLLEAAKELEIDLSVSWMIGDILNDV